jgi:hypothetical protein
MGTSLHVFICSTRNLMVGKNPLWVAKQHGHSIATMLRAYAAWAEDTAEVDVEAIKRSMNATEAPPAINLILLPPAREGWRSSTRGPRSIMELVRIRQN